MCDDCLMGYEPDMWGMLAQFASSFLPLRVNASYDPSTAERPSDFAVLVLFEMQDSSVAG